MAEKGRNEKIKYLILAGYSRSGTSHCGVNSL
jgi:hypothetical protein